MLSYASLNHILFLSFGFCSFFVYSILLLIIIFFFLLVLVPSISIAVIVQFLFICSLSPFNNNRLVSRNRPITRHLCTKCYLMIEKWNFSYLFWFLLLFECMLAQIFHLQTIMNIPSALNNSWYIFIVEHKFSIKCKFYGNENHFLKQL